MDRAYAYDPIGNRTVSRRGSDPNTTYQTNSLNQYTAIDDPVQELGSRLVHDPDGNLTELYAASDVDGDGVIDQDDIDFILFCFGLPQDDPNCGMDVEQFARADFNSNGVIDQDDVDAVMFYFGTTISETLSARLSWDGENRLTRWEPRVPQAGSKKVDFRYDYRNRRVEKRDSTFSGSAWAVSDVRRFIWSDWLPLAELKGDPNDPNEPNKYKVERYYTWGLNLAGLSGSVNSLQSAGGIGGLLACRDPNDPNDPNDLYGDFLYFFDGNGNVGQLVDVAGSATGAPLLAAKYEYDPYGNTLRAPADPNSGPYAAANPVRFSTKPWDDETGLGDWGLRYYDGSRWISRDPLFEARLEFISDGRSDAMRQGQHRSTNLMEYCVNRPVSVIDPDGRFASAGCCGPEVGPRLYELLDTTIARFGELPASDQRDYCEGSVSPVGWDVRQLRDVSGGGTLPGLSDRGCGTGNCRGTVRVDGVCYHAGELNYVWWGLTSRLCGRSFEWSQLLVLGHRGGVKLGVFSPGVTGPVGPGTNACRISFMMEGYVYADNETGLRVRLQAPGCAMRRCGSDCCRTSYVGELWGRLGGHRFVVP